MACRLLCSLVIVAPIILAAAEERKAIAVLKGDPGVSGNVNFVQNERGGPVTFRVTISGLPKGKYVLTVNEKGDISNGCSSTAGLFNPDKKANGVPEDVARYAGNLGNIIMEDIGVANVTMAAGDISLGGKVSIIGRSVVVHSDPDDLGRGGFSDSLLTRVACGVIGIQ